MRSQKTVTRVKYGVIAVFLALLLALPTMLWESKANTALGVAGPQFNTDYANYTEMLDAGDEFNVELSQESFVLLKNNGALPLNMTTQKKVSLFSNASYNHIKGGSGSGGGNSNYGTVRTATTIKEGLEFGGFEVNPTLAENHPTRNDGYGDQRPIAELKFTAMEQSYVNYNGAAILTFARGGGEFNEYQIYNIAGHTDKTDHAYMLNDAEKELIAYVKTKFSTIVVLINANNPMEIAELHDDPDIDAIMWIGGTGKTGAKAIGPVLSGAVNPSGRLVDVYHSNFKKDPTWQNFMGNVQANPSRIVDVDGVQTLQFLKIGGNAAVEADWQVVEQPAARGTPDATYLSYSRFTDKDGNLLIADGPSASARFYSTLDYEEGIYMGYRYYETAASDNLFGAMATADGVADLTTYMPAGVTDEYYNRYNGVLYPFGYGLSYTNFEWKIDNSPRTLTDKDGNVTIDVRVTNKGTKAGKDVIQVYSNPPYYTGGIEKASANLVDFAKTKMLKPGESQLLTISFAAREMASFDHDDKNQNGFAGYELEAGSYFVSLRTDSHNIKPGCEIEIEVEDKTIYGEFDSAAVNGKNGFFFNRDAKTGAEIKTLFTGSGTWDGTRSGDTPDSLTYYDSRRTDFVSEQAWTELTRANFVATRPAAPTADDLKLTDDALKILDSQVYYSSFNDLSTDPWYKSKSDIPLTWTQAADTTGRVNNRTKIQLAEMTGVSFDDPKWAVFMNQLTFDEMRSLISSNRFTTAANNAIGKPASSDQDGPVQLSGGVFFCGEINQGSTYNVDLAYKQGRFVAEASKFNGVAGWYGPGLNTHRNPMAGRNFEYYSQDGLHGGKIAAAVIKAATDGGMVVYMKHLFLNDQETSRYVASTFVSEQAIREIYGRIWEWAIKEGNANASMSAFNRIGLNSMSNYNLYVRLLEEEWGFKASSVTDMYGWQYNPGQSGDMSARVNITPLGSWTNTFGRNIEGTWNAARNTVEVEFTRDITNGTNWNNVFNEPATPAKPAEGDTPAVAEVPWSLDVTSKSFNATNAANIQTINRGGSAAYKNATTMKNGTTLYVKGDKMDSYTQWFAVRNAAQHLLYVHANANTLRNGIIENPLLVGALTAGTTANPIRLGTFVNGTAAGISLLPTAALSDYRTDVTGHKTLYTITAGALPTGMTLNANTGAITGTPTENGTYNFTARIVVDDWIGTGQATNVGNYTASYRLVVADADTSIQDAIDDILSRLDAIDVEITGIKSRLSTLETKVATLETKTAALETKATALQAEIDALEADLAALDTELTAAIAAGDAALEAKLKTDIDALKAKVTTLETDVAALIEAGCGSSILSSSTLVLFGFVALALAALLIFAKRRTKED